MLRQVPSPKPEQFQGDSYAMISILGDRVTLVTTEFFQAMAVYKTPQAGVAWLGQRRPAVDRDISKGTVAARRHGKAPDAGGRCI